MSLFRTVARRTTFVHAARFQQRSFGVSAMRWAGKEDALHHEGRAEEIEQHKQDQLNKQKDGEGHWKDELASNSESIVKAERGEIDASEDTIKKLQEESVKLTQGVQSDADKTPKA